MPWIHEKPNEYVVFCFVFYVKKSLSGIVLISFHLLQWFNQSYSQTFWATDLYLQIFFIMDPNLMSHQFSAQPTRKDKTNSKIDITKSVKK